MLKVIYTSYFKNGGSKPPPYRESCKIHCFLIWDDVGIVPYKLEFCDVNCSPHQSLRDSFPSRGSLYLPSP